ncbi:MBL fold metallo-hydrolase [Cellulomonas marina]|uniref:Glyoxylase, beta-lactamase superfamily II n=1 Tax=Cellulomonas marina TaxID=988821 RepID=A0A1I0ZGJ7_9CELL|nr:MBL fold metallo-hydrolase [Cellulomonas marina]GIG28535.1 MBL fold metallo-hydrolase [Cellulomonas marina]SFB24492.1 Glyoxylase, beta-lactamase superfamily II [Cellulomonas marina]
MLTEVADRVHRIDHAYVNCYLVEEEGRLLLVDTGVPAHWRRIGEAVRALGRRPSDVVAVALTHGHFDHTGNVARAMDVLGVPVWAGTEDLELVEHPYRYAHENPLAAYPLRHPAGVPVLAALMAAGAWHVRGARGLRAYESGGVLPVPGRPVVVDSPGHTWGHVALHLPERGVLLSGDALVTLDPYTGGRGPQIVAGAATADSAAALASLDALEATGAATVLPGHGDPWTAGVAEAAARAREVGAH